MAVIVKAKGNYNKIRRFLKKNVNKDYTKILEQYGKAGCDALAAATPVDTGITQASWYYKIQEDDEGNITLSWINTSVTSRGTPIVILLRYGHATRNGGYVQGRDFINPTIRPLFDSFTKVVWKEVTTP